jgi:D-alanyl-lipoteichoic acid acyltransferase DltB (MBOAT superfamily)
MSWGIFKKVVIADRLAPFVNQVYSNPREYQGISLITATFFFAFQVYCDFSGYTDIARGGGKVMGFEIMENFDRPYSAKSITEFWRRWHISLSTWIRDYVFLPMAINMRRLGNRGLLYAVMVAFILVGLWHGANWNYLLFGVLHGLALSYEALTAPNRKRLSKKIPRQIYSYICLFLTFSYINFTFIFFRAKNISDALYIVANLFTGVGYFCANLFVNSTLPFYKNLFASIFPSQSSWEFLFAISLICIVGVIDLIAKRGDIISMLSAKPVWIRWPVYYCIVLAIGFAGKSNGQQFIYFQF